MTTARPLAVLGSVLALAVGCAGSVRPEVVQAWVGRPAAALQQEWGVATREVPDGDLKILVYEEVESRTSSPTFDSTTLPRNRIEAAHLAAQQVYRTPTVYVRSYLFWVNPAGTIVHALIRQP